jgi:RNA polymerase sigma factor (sigma-70 family)
MRVDDDERPSQYLSWEDLPEDFVSRLRRGDEDSWKHAVRLLREQPKKPDDAWEDGLRRATNGSVDVDDLFWTGCGKLLSQLKKDDDFLRDGPQAIPWTFHAICRSIFRDVLDHYAEEQRRREPFETEKENPWKEVPDKNSVNPRDATLTAEIADRVMESLNSLCGRADIPDGRELIFRRFVMGESHKKLAEVTGHRETTVPRLLKKALDHLRTLLSNIDPEEFSQVVPLPQKEPVPEGDLLECAAYAPAAVTPGATFMLQVFAHLRSLRDEATHLARTFDDRAEVRGSSGLQQRVLRGETLTFDLFLTGGKSDEIRLSLIWSGQTDSVTFLVTADHHIPGSELFGRVTVSLKAIPIGRIVFKVRTDSRVSGEPRVMGKADRFRSYFVSYAREDKSEVIKCVKLLRSLGKDGKQDILNIEPGEQWEQKLHEFIRESDVTLLFWSSHAKASAEVRKECRYCVELKGLDSILPVILEKPPPEPFPELAKIHMDDRLLYFVE